MERTVHGIPREVGSTHWQKPLCF